MSFLESDNDHLESCARSDACHFPFSQLRYPSWHGVSLHCLPRRDTVDLALLPMIWNELTLRFGVKHLC